MTRENDTPEPTLIEVRDAVFGYGHRAVVKVDELRLNRGTCLGIFGPNGSGKTTLVRGITGLLSPMAGQVLHAPTGGRSGGAGAHGRPGGLRIGYLQQHRAIELQWPMTAFDAAGLATSARKLFGWLGPGTKNVLAMMARLGIDHLASRPFPALSGGQQQRVLLAGALASEPTVLVLDEPTEGLDVRSTQELLDVLREFINEGVAMMVISHEADDLMQIAQQIAWLHAGQQQGEASGVEMVTPTALAERLLQIARRQA